MVNHPLRTLVEQARTWVNKHLLVVADGLIAFSRVLASAVVEETGADRLAYLGIVLQLEGAARDYRQPKPIHDCDQLFADVLASLHCTSLDEVFVAPLVLKAVHLPSLVHCKHSQMVTVLMIELGSFLVCELLLLSGTIEDVLDGQHRYDSDDLLRAAEIN